MNPVSARPPRRHLFSQTRLRRLLSAATAVLLLACASASQAAPVNARGVIERRGDCVLFMAYEEAVTYRLPDIISVEEPEKHRVIAESYALPWSCGGLTGSERLRNVILEPCTPDTFGCGVIRVSGLGCHEWRSLAGHGAFVLSSLEGFTVGDTVLATGIPCPPCPISEACDSGVVVMLEMRIFACADTIIPAREHSWGRIKNGYR